MKFPSISSSSSTSLIPTASFVVFYRGRTFLVMDWAVWDRSHDQVVRESSYMGHEWQHDFYLGYGLDLIEENALNEKSCIQVLRVLMTKANTEILELEEDLITLQSQLAWADESWSEICSAVLREKIDCLDILIQDLKNTNVQDELNFGVCLQLHREPAEKMHDIVKALLENYFDRNDEQPANSIVNASNLDPSTTEVVLTNGMKIVSDLESSKYVLAPGDNFVTQKSSPMTPVKRTNQEPPVDSVVLKEDQSLKMGKDDVKEKGQNECTIAKFFSSDALRNATDDSSEKKDLSKFDLRINGKDEFETHYFASKESNLVSNSSLKPAQEGRDIPRRLKLASASSSDSSKHAVSPKGKNRLNRIDSRLNGHKEVKELNSNDKSIILKPSLQLGGRETKFSETVEPADPIVEFISSSCHIATEESNVYTKQSEGLDSASIDKIEPPISSFKIKKKRIKTPLGMKKDPETDITDDERNAANSLMLIVNQHITKQLKEEPKCVAKLATSNDESNSDMLSKPQKPRAKKRKCQSTQCLGCTTKPKKCLRNSLVKLTKAKLAKELGSKLMVRGGCT
ncbi:hypothetical protein U1Q18_012941 [Sarracenia purpurea var. burkii]